MGRYYDETFAECMMYYLHVNGKTQKQLGEEIGYTEGAISKIKNGDRKIPKGFEEKISKVLKIRVEDLHDSTIKFKNNLNFLKEHLDDDKIEVSDRQVLARQVFETIPISESENIIFEHNKNNGLWKTFFEQTPGCIITISLLGVGYIFNLHPHVYFRELGLLFMMAAGLIMVQNLPDKRVISKIFSIIIYVMSILSVICLFLLFAMAY